MPAAHWKEEKQETGAGGNWEKRLPSNSQLLERFLGFSVEHEKKQCYCI